MEQIAHSRTPKPIQTDLGYRHQQDARSARRRSPRVSCSRLNHTPIDAHRELEHEESLTRVWEKFQADWKLREESHQSSGFLPPHLHDSGQASTSYLHEAKNRFSHPMSSSQIAPCQDAEFVNTFRGGQSRVASSSYDRQLRQRYLSYPPPPTQQMGSPPRAYKDNLNPEYHPLPPSSLAIAERFAQGRSNWSSAPIQPQEYSNTPIDHLQTGSSPDPSGYKLRGLTRRPRVRNPYRGISRAPGDAPTKSVDPEAPQVTKLGYSVMSVRHSNPDGSGSSSSSRFVLPLTAARPIPIGGSGGGARHLGAFPSSHVESETERPIPRIKAREGAGSAPISIYSIPKKGPRTLVTASLMDHMEEESPSLSPVSTPKAPSLDQPSVIREDLQQGDERPIAGCRADPQISSREATEVEGRNSLELVHSISPSIEVSHLGVHAVTADKGDGRNQPVQQSLFQELYQLLDPLAHPNPDALRSETKIPDDGRSGEEVVCPVTPRGPGRSDQILHVDILLAQRVVRDAMQEDGEYAGFSYQSCMLSASECGEEAADSGSNLSECGLDRKHSTRSVFDWRYA